MFLWLLFLFIAVPLAEIWTIGQVWGAIGGPQTLGLLLLDSIVGAMLVKHQGLGILDRIQRRLSSGSMPTDDLIDGGLVLFAGALMLTPGFITDGVGLLLLLPPTRSALRSVVGRRLQVRIERSTVIGSSAGFGGGATGFRPGFVTGFSATRSRPSPARPGDRTIDLDDDAVVEDRLVEDLTLEDRGPESPGSGLS